MGGWVDRWMDGCLMVIPAHPKHYSGNGMKSSPSSPLKPQFLPGQMIPLLLHCSALIVPPPALSTGVGVPHMLPHRNFVGYKFVTKLNHNNYKDSSYEVL